MSENKPDKKEDNKKETPNKGQPISTSSDWNFDLIQQYDMAIAELAKRNRLDTYPNQIEVISAEQMMDAYAASGMPIGYHHWSYGKHFLNTQRGYQRGQMGLAYEIVINSNPCIAYLMEENTMAMQVLVIAHACYGHNSFFKGNYLFKAWTDASAIIDYLVFARKYIAKCEERYGIDEVEPLLDACHALMNHGVDRYKRPNPISAEQEREKQQDREEYIQRHINSLWRTIPQSQEEKKPQKHRFPSEPQENLLYFIEKNAPMLKPWQREIVRIVRKIAQYFYPQRQTQVMNEGWASFWHYNLSQQLHEAGLINDGYLLEILTSHTNVIFQPDYDSPYFSGINPYTLGYAIYTDIKRICEHPTDEDKHWFPDLAGKDWLDSIHFAMQNFKDESFILQYLSPKVMRDLKLFSIYDDERKLKYHVDSIHDEKGYHNIRQELAKQYDLSYREANIQVYSVDVEGDRSMTLHHYMNNNIPLSADTTDVLKHITYLWGFDVHMKSIQDGEIKKEYHCPEQTELSIE